MKTVTINVYTFDELNDEAKELARVLYRDIISSHGYPWGDDSLKSIHALAKHFGGTMSNWDIDWWYGNPSHAVFSMPNSTADEIESKLGKLGAYDPATLLGLGECKLTGYCADDSAIDGFRRAWVKGERNLESLMQAAFQCWLKDCQDDAIHMFKNEYIDENMIECGYLFDIKGERVKYTKQELN